MKKNLVLRSFLHAIGTLAYIAAVVYLLSNGEAIFGHGPEPALLPVFMLLLFVISACITSFLVLGRPIQLYLDGEKKEALTMLFATVSWLIFFLVIIAVLILST